MSSSPGLFEGVKVVEFTQIAAGPVIGTLLAAFGAQVVHVESRERPDPFREYPPHQDNIGGPDRAAPFACFNPNKLGITLNLRHSKGPELAKKLVAWADLVLENFVPGTMERLGLDYGELSQAKPELIMLSTCNQGQTGPHATHPGLGSHLTNLAGFSYLTGWPDRPPVLLYGPYIDFIAVGYAACALVAALDYRQRTGQGQYIDISQYETGLQFMAPALLDYQANGRLLGREGNRSPFAAPHGAYPCAGEDRWCVIAVHSDEEWERLRLTMGDPAWAREPRFATLRGRKENEEELDQHMALWSRSFEARELMEKLQAAGVEAGVVLEVREFFDDPHHQLYSFREVEHPFVKPCYVLAPPFHLSRTPYQFRTGGPLLGADNEYVWTKLAGLSEAEFRRWQREGVID